jgi:dTDP-4-dehydrorhamnose 3,5-epimerase
MTQVTDIDGVHLIPLKVIEDARGSLMHVLRADSPFFKRFGEVYLSEINPAVVKGWKRHLRMTQHLAVPYGRVKFAMHDNRQGSPTHGVTASCELGRPDAYALLVVPPLVWYAWACLGDRPAMLVNCADLPHDPAESELRTLPDTLESYAW